MSRPAHCAGPVFGSWLLEEMGTADGHSSVPSLFALERDDGGHDGAGVLIAHADASCRGVISRLLHRSGIAVVASVPDGEAAVRAARRTAPALALVGVDLAGLSVAETTRRLTRVAPASRVLVFGTAGSEYELGGAFGAGAAGYVRVDAGAERLDVTVRIAIALLARACEASGPARRPGAEPGTSSLV
jgi:DNA-binding NtrC family response regulator